MGKEVQSLGEEAEDDRATFRCARMEWEGEIARAEQKAHDVAWTLGEELAKLKPLVEKHEGVWTSMERFREKVSGSIVSQEDFERVTGKVDHLQEALAQTLSVHTQAGDSKCNLEAQK